MSGIAARVDVSNECLFRWLLYRYVGGDPASRDGNDSAGNEQGRNGKGIEVVKAEGRRNTGQPGCITDRMFASEWLC